MREQAFALSAYKETKNSFSFSFCQNNEAIASWSGDQLSSVKVGMKMTESVNRGVNSKWVL